jgi:hypothetical protein
MHELQKLQWKDDLGREGMKMLCLPLIPAPSTAQGAFKGGIIAI